MKNSRLRLLVATAFLLSLAFPNPASAGSVSFASPQVYGVGLGPWAVAVGDFSGGGGLDLVATNDCANPISVLLGNGDGTFGPAQIFYVAPNPQVVTVRDLNGDGKLDLAVANSGSTVVSVLLGRGDGTFQPPLTYEVGDFNPTYVAVGDVNGDGKLDLVVPTYGCFYYAPCPIVSQTVSVLIGAITQQQVATPTFSPAGGTFASPQSVAIPDATPGATIYYTTDGSTPTTASPAYSGPILVMQTTTIQAMATASGMTNSAVASATYTFLQQVATPTFTPAGGTYTSPQSVAIADATPGATIHYTTDGSKPTTA